MYLRTLLALLILIVLAGSGCASPSLTEPPTHEAAPTLIDEAVTEAPTSLLPTAVLPSPISASSADPTRGVESTSMPTPDQSVGRAAASPTPTVTLSLAAQTPTATPSASVKLTVDPVDVRPGDVITMRWETTGVSPAGWIAQLRLIPHGASHGPLTYEWFNLPASGEMQIPADGVDRERYRVMVQVFNVKQGGGASAETTIRYPCPDAYFFGTRDNGTCPASAASSPQAAQQSFEGGRMVWLASTNQIYVLYGFASGGSVARVANTWANGEPESDPSITPPDGKYQPVRGFGKVWRENSAMREALGWALAPEQGFTSMYQKEYLTCSAHPSGCNGWVPAEFMRLIDERVIYMSFAVQHGARPTWGYVNP